MSQNDQAALDRKRKNKEYVEQDDVWLAADIDTATATGREWKRQAIQRLQDNKNIERDSQMDSKHFQLNTTGKPVQRRKPK